MRGTRTVLASGLLTLVLITGSSARSAADECLAKPNGPTPQGQHWYYRIDHANNGRQCWYMRTEIARAQKASRQTARDSSDAMAQMAQAQTAPAEMTPEETAPVAAAPIPWLNVRPLPEPVAVPKHAPPMPAVGTTTVGMTDSATRERRADPPTAGPGRPAPTAHGSPAPMQRAREWQHRRQAQVRPEPPALAIAEIDHTFALLMVLFAALAMAGPALHFMERRRRREAIIFRPPPWARVVALNAPTPRIRAMSRPQVAKSQPAKPLAPVPLRPPDQTERLAHALQQLVDRLQTIERPRPKAVHIRPRGRASM